jgi:hypothetical protein
MLLLYVPLPRARPQSTIAETAALSDETAAPSPAPGRSPLVAYLTALFFACATVRFAARRFSSHRPVASVLPLSGRDSSVPCRPFRRPSLPLRVGETVPCRCSVALRLSDGRRFASASVLTSGSPSPGSVPPRKPSANRRNVFYSCSSRFETSSGLRRAD